mgnify:CR=1 FL=1|jgi:small subunit ribosomal protein S20
MANIKSSKKDIKTTRARTIRNRARSSEIKNLTKKVLGFIEGKDFEEARGLFSTVQSKIARAAGKGLYKKNTASRKIARLARHIGVMNTAGK